MTKVRIEVLVDDPSRDDVDTVMECAPGSDVVDACDAACAPIDFSCRAACCSTCRIQVLAGAEWLAPPGDLEDELIAASGEAPSTAAPRPRAGGDISRRLPVRQVRGARSVDCTGVTRLHGIAGGSGHGGTRQAGKGPITRSQQRLVWRN